MLSKPCTGSGKIKGVVFLTDAQLLELRIKTLDFDLLIGVDPGVATGLAFWDRRDKKLTYVGSPKIHQALELVRGSFTHSIGGPGRFVKDRVLVRLEDARLRRWIPKSKNEKANRGRNQGAGSIKRDCQIWEDFLQDLGFIYQLVPPAAGRSKWPADYFTRLTGWTGRTSNHGRDAAALVYGL